MDGAINHRDFTQPHLENYIILKYKRKMTFETHFRVIQFCSFILFVFSKILFPKSDTLAMSHYFKFVLSKFLSFHRYYLYIVLTIKHSVLHKCCALFFFNIKRDKLSIYARAIRSFEFSRFFVFKNDRFNARTLHRLARR